MVNAETCSMDGIIDYDLGVGTRSSPRSLAIEKAQEEIRQKCDVREERKRELEFLEKGGNPLDFKFAHLATVSVHSTSLTNQTAEENVLSEAKGSFAASPYGDSVEGSDKPGSSLCCETNTADNLMHWGGDKSDIVQEKIVRRGTKRSNAAQPKQPLPTGGHRNAEKTKDSGLSRLGVKSQAYVRRNRSKPSRESANIASIRSVVTTAKGSDPKEEKSVVQGKHEDEHVVLPVSSIKPVGLKCDNAPKNTASDDQVAMELDGIQTVRESDSVLKNELKAEEVASVETPDANSKVVIRPCDSSASTQDERESCSGYEKANDSHLDKPMAHFHGGELDNRRIAPVCAVEDSSIHKNIVDPPCEGTKNIVDDHADADINLVVTKIDANSHQDLDNSRHSNKTLKESRQSECFSGPTSVKVNFDPIQPESSNIHHMKDEMEVCDSAIVAQNDAECPSSGRNMDIEESPASDRNESYLGDPNSGCPIAVSADLLDSHALDAIPSVKNDESYVGNEIKKSEERLDKMAYEDSIIRNARGIEASIKRAGERLLSNVSLEKRRKGHWDFVLEEMAWMANDFMQERLWKSVAAAQMCHWITSGGRAKFEEANIQRKQKTIMKKLTKGIMSFWHSAEASQTAHSTAKMTQDENPTMLEETKASGIKAEKEHSNKTPEAEESRQPRQSQIQDYAVRFLEYNSRTADPPMLAEAPRTPDRLNDFGILKVSDQLSEGSLFYTVAPGAMLAYRESVESLFEYHKKVGNTELKDDYEASVCDSAADFPRECTYEADEGETSTYLSPEAYDRGFLSKMNHKKKHKMHQRFTGARPYDIGTDVSYEPCLESKSGNRPLLSNGKRSTSFLAVPAKRSRTTARQRVVSPFCTGATGTPHVTSKTDASSGDTSSLQDDESSLHGGSLPRRNMDYESTVDFDRRLPYDAREMPTKANKKKKLKNSGYKTVQNAVNSCAPASNRMYAPRLQVEDYLKKRSEIQQYSSNGISVANGGQHASKKLKIMKQEIDDSHEASHVASQKSDMAHPARFIKIIANRDRARKFKALKMVSSDGWSNFEDQALVVLVHDMGHNWELVSDAINSIVQFKSVHRQPNECKERHKVLMDRSSGDGADSAEDSGSSQRYHNSLPGIPKGTARQLFERLQGPFEEENLKEHFEKIILLIQRVHSRCRQGNNQELKPIMQPHSSHVMALSQTCVNNLPGSSLTPLDLCDAISPNLDPVTSGSVYLGSHTNRLTLPNHQGSAGPATPTSNLSSRLPGSPGMVLGNNLSSPSTLNTHRDAQKYSVPRPTSSQVDEQPKIQYSQMVNGRNIQQPGGSVTGVFPAGVDRSARMMPGAQMAGLSRGMPAAMAGIPRISSPGGLNVVSSANLAPNKGLGVPSAVNVHPGAISGPGNSILRPCDPVQILHPGQSMEEHKQVPDMHMQVSQGSNQVAHFSSVNPSFSNVAASSPVQQPQQPQQMSQSSHLFGNPDHSQIQGTSSSPQQRGYAMRLPKERQMQQYMVPQQHNNLSGASAVPSMQTGSHILQQNQSTAVNPVPCPQPQYQRQQTAKNPSDASSSPNLPSSATLQKQMKQQGQQQSRQNQQQRNQASQQAKLMKSLGRGNMLIPQTPVDSLPTNAVPKPSKKHVPDKKLMQHGQGFFPANTTASQLMVQPSNQSKLHAPLPQSPKQLPDIGNRSVMQASLSQTLLDPQQPQQQRQIITSQNSNQRTIMQQHRQVNSECTTYSFSDQAQHDQMVPATSVAQSTDSGSPLLSSIDQLKCEASHNPASVTSSSNLLSTPNDTSFGDETLRPSSSHDELQRQISGGFPMHSQVIDSQWNQHARQQMQSQHQQGPVVQGSVYAPSNSGSG